MWKRWDAALMDRGALPEARPPATTTGKIADTFLAVSADELEHFAGIDLARQRLGDGRWDTSCHARVEAVDHNCLEIGNDLPEFGSGLTLVEIWLAVNNRLVVGFNGSSHVGSLVSVGGIAKPTFIVNLLLLEGSVAAERREGLTAFRAAAVAVTLPRRAYQRRLGATRRSPARSWAAHRSPRQ